MLSAGYTGISTTLTDVTPVVHVQEALNSEVPSLLSLPTRIRCQATPTFTSSGDTQCYEVSRNGAAPGGALTVKSQSARPGAAGRRALMGWVTP